MNKKSLIIQALVITMLVLGIGSGAAIAKEVTEILVGANLSLTGPLAMDGKEQKWAYDQAVADFNKDGWLDLLFGNYFQPLNLLDLDTPHVLPNNLDYADNGFAAGFKFNNPKAVGTCGCGSSFTV